MELESKAYGKGNDEGPVEGKKERKADYSGGDLKESDSSPEASRQLCKTSHMIPLSFFLPDVVRLGTGVEIMPTDSLENDLKQHHQITHSLILSAE